LSPVLLIFAIDKRGMSYGTIAISSRTTTLSIAADHDHRFGHCEQLSSQRHSEHR